MGAFTTIRCSACEHSARNVSDLLTHWQAVHRAERSRDVWRAVAAVLAGVLGVVWVVLP